MGGVELGISGGRCRNRGGCAEERSKEKGTSCNGGSRRCACQVQGYIPT